MVGVQRAAHVLALVVGLLALYVAYFLYEDQQGRLQNRLEDIWIAIADRALLTDTKTTALFNKIAEAIGGGFTRFFGDELVSVQSIGVSLAYSLGGTLAIAGLGYAWMFHEKAHLLHHPNLPNPQGLVAIWNHPSLPYICAALSIVFFLVACLPMWRRNRITTALTWLPLLMTICWTARQVVKDQETSRILPTATVLVASTLADIVLIAIVRRVLRQISTQLKLFSVFRLVLIQILFTCLLVGLPLVLTNEVADRVPTLGGYAMGIFVINLTTSIISLVPLAGLLFVLLHRMFWPLSSRLFYPLARYRIIYNRKGLVAGSIACFGYALGFESKLIESALSLFKD
jgi:hypothetical protein